jgi:hypothetical protein
MAGLEDEEPQPPVRSASGAFITELLRKAAVFAEEDGEGELVVRDRHLEEGLTELLVAGGALTQSLLGAKVGSG